MAGSGLGDETFHVVLYQAALALGELVKSEGGSMRLRVIFATILIVMAGCGSSRPELYPNDQVRRVGGEAAERDIDDCIAQAERSRAEINKEATSLEPPEKGCLPGRRFRKRKKFLSTSACEKRDTNRSVGIRSTIKPKLAAGNGETLTSRCPYRLTESMKPLFSS
jgi:hypothetical protein